MWLTRLTQVRCLACQSPLSTHRNDPSVQKQKLVLSSGGPINSNSKKMYIQKPKGPEKPRTKWEPSTSSRTEQGSVGLLSEEGRGENF